MSQHILLFQKTKMSDQYLPYHLMQFQKLKNVVTRYFDTKFTETSSMTAWTVYTNAKLFFDKKKKRELANIRPSLHFSGMIILVKKKGLCIGMAGLPFQKGFQFISIF